MQSSHHPTTPHAMSTTASNAPPLPTYNQVTKHNLAGMQPMIVQLLKQASFLALDAEFTGLGPNSQTTRAKDIQERYQHLCALAKSHAMVAFGLSIFIRVEPSSAQGQSKETDSRKRAYNIHNFNFSMLSESDYMVSPNSMVFLAENGLDLNQWVLEGIPYSGGNRETNDGGRGNPNGIMRSIFKRIMTRRVPVVVHNGFLDLIFLYHSFYANLPPKLSTFVADLSDMFEGGIFDTKYISDYITRERSSFLAYLFRKYERAEIRAKEPLGPTGAENKQIYSDFSVQAALPIPPRPPGPSSTPRKRNKQGREDTSEYCESYAFHGVCKQKMKCGKSHDLDLILDAEEAQLNSKKRKGNNSLAVSLVQESSTEAEAIAADAVATSTSDTTPSTDETVTSTPPATVQPTPTAAVVSSEKFHSAYFDAFMTGAVFSYQLNSHSPEKIQAESVNKIYLIGKDIPLKLEKSAFTKYSPEHERQRALT